MKTFRRFVALVVFVAAGVVLAVYVATTTPPRPVSAAQPAVVSPAPLEPMAAEAVEVPGDTPCPAQQDSAAAEEAPPQVAPEAVAENNLPDTPSAPAGNSPEPGVAATAVTYPGYSACPPAAVPYRVPAYPPVWAEPHPGYAERASSSTADEVMLRLASMLQLQQERAAAVPESQPPPPAPEIAPEGLPAEPPVRAELTEEGNGSLVLNTNGEDIRTVLAMLGEAGDMNILASKSVQGTVSATLKGVDVDSALEAVLRSTGFASKREGNFIYVGTPDEFDSMEQSLDTLGTRVYRPNYITAAELQNLVQALLTENKGVASVSSPSKAGIEADEATAGGDDYAGGDVLVVRDYESVLVQIDRMVSEIDVRPMQVHIEAMILSVLLDDGNDLGVNLAWLGNNAKVGWGGFPTSDDEEGDNGDMLGNITFDGNGLKFGFFDGNVAAFINALETVGDTNVIATPRLMALNKQKAEIHIGEELGYVSTTVSETSTTQSVDFLSTGTVLRLRPFISSDGLIRMEVHPELSTGTVDVEGGFTLPNKETTQVTSNIMVRDGCTVVIGGLIRDETSVTTSQVPLFGSLPVVGAAFRTTSEKLGRREIIVLITPRIVYEPDTCREGEHIACEFHRRQGVNKEKMSWYGKRALGRRYYRLAQVAWANGDRDRALRFAELAVHFDPMSRAAIDLRSDIWLGNPQGDHTLATGMAAGTPTAADPAVLDAEALPPWLLNDLKGDLVPQPQPTHPLDRGRPGTSVEVNRPRKLQ